MAKVFVQATHGPEDPTRATLAFLIARTAKDSGHEVSIGLVGDAVYLMKDEVMASVVGVGVGGLKEQFQAVLDSKIPIYVSQMSSRGRGITEDDLMGKNASFILPPRLVELATQSDTVLSY